MFVKSIYKYSFNRIDISIDEVNVIKASRNRENKDKTLKE